ncbi:D-2-hydroxyacid dehydrogenase [Micrococcales bacterium 31B]|nr:D-2-hydroxyacid dehydrogenase [Micrococcales bacterium 31B]
MITTPPVLTIATPLPERLEGPMAELAARHGLALLYERDLLPPQRYPGDHFGVREFRRTPEQEAQFTAMLNAATFLYGIPGESATRLAQVVAENPALRWVQTMAAGGGSQVVSAKLTAAQHERVTFTTSAGVHGDSLAEFAVLGLLAGTKDLPAVQADQARAHWPAERTPVRQLKGSTVLILGLGEIGAATAQRCKALGMTVWGTKRTPAEVPHVDRVLSNAQIGEVIGEVDHVVVTLPGTSHTVGLLSADIFARARRGLTVVNVGRGTVIVEADLIEALRSGQVGYAALDVFEREPLAPQSPLWTLPNVLCAPHGMALDAREDDNIFALFEGNLQAYLEGAPLRNVVNPEFGY